MFKDRPCDLRTILAADSIACARGLDEGFSFKCARVLRANRASCSEPPCQAPNLREIKAPRCCCFRIGYGDSTKQAMPLYRLLFTSVARHERRAYSNSKRVFSCPKSTYAVPSSKALAPALAPSGGSGPRGPKSRCSLSDLFLKKTWDLHRTEKKQMQILIKRRVYRASCSWVGKSLVLCSCRSIASR